MAVHALLRALLNQCDYQTYVKMQAVGNDDSTYSGDVHVLRDGKIVAICGEVTFQKIARRVLRCYFLPLKQVQIHRKATPSKPQVMTLLKAT